MAGLLCRSKSRPEKELNLIRWLSFDLSGRARKCSLARRRTRFLLRGFDGRTVLFSEGEGQVERSVEILEYMLIGRKPESARRIAVVS